MAVLFWRYCNKAGCCLAVLKYGGTFLAVLKYGGTFLAVPGISYFGGTDFGGSR